jgi:CubicO group peptidase (beta-lactamase class C family)
MEKKMDITREDHTHKKIDKSLRKNNNPGFRRIFRRIIITLIILVLGLVLAASGGYLWARLSTDTSLAARGIIWGESHFDDWKRFPSRSINASSSPVIFDLQENEIFSEFEIDGQSLESFLEATNTTALVVLQGDSLIYEGYFNDSDSDSPQASMSVAKSFVSTLIAIAVQEGFINNLDDPVTLYIPELLERDPRFERITIQHLLMMTSGLRFEADDSNPFSDDFITSHSPDLRKAALSVEIVEAPGNSYNYNDYNPLLLGMILERSTGMTVSEYLETRLWGPMGAEDKGSWDLDSKRSGFERMSVGINARAIDFAKLGWLFLNEGQVGAKQVVPENWVAGVTKGSQAIFTSRGDHSNYYQHYWFLDVENGSYYAEGNFCQFIYVYPAADLVLVRHGSDCGGVFWTGLLGEMAKETERRLQGDL